jgi:hypothetical protein
MAEMRCEASYAYNVVTGEARYLGSSLGREYPELADGEFAGTVDLLLLGSKRAIIKDYKTGRKKTPARMSWQLRFLGLAVSRAHHFDEIRAEMAYIDGDGDVTPDGATFDAFDLAGFAGELSRAYASMVAATTSTQPHVGRWCEYCPGMVACPATHALVATALQERVPAITAESVARAYRQAKLLKKFATEVEQATKAYASQFLVDLGGGMLLGPHRTTRRSLSGAVAREVLTAAYSAEVADEACEFKTSQAAIKRAITPAAPKRGIKAAMDAVMAQLKAKGGIEVKVSNPVEEYEGELPRLEAP